MPQTNAQSSVLSSVARRFSRAARRYPEKTPVQAAAAVRLMTMIAPLPEPAHIVEIGAGAGGLTRLLLDAYPRAMIEAVDISGGMLALARAYLSDNARLRVIEAEAGAYRPSRECDLIVSSSALQWIHPLGTAIRRWVARLQPGGHLAVSVMIEGTLGELHALRQRLVSERSPRRRLPEASAIVGAVEEAGLTIVARAEETTRTFHPSAIEFLRRLHDQGVTGGDLSIGDRPLTRGELGRLIAAYDREFRSPDGTVFATWRMLDLLAVKPVAPGRSQ